MKKMKEKKEKEVVDKNEEVEINKLLNLKLEKLGKLDICDDGLDFDYLYGQKQLDVYDGNIEKKDDSLVEVHTVFKELQGVPFGEEGFKLINKSHSVLKIEKELSQPNNDQPIGKALSEKVTQLSVTERTESYKISVQTEYDMALRQIEVLTSDIKKGNRVSNKQIQEIVKYFMSVFMKDRCILLNLSNYRADPEDYLFNHMLNVCLISINIATASGFSEQQVLEVGEAGLLADIGMLLISDKVRFNSDKLKIDERYDVHKHPILGLYALEKIIGIPPVVTHVAYQHHERITGVGYPKNRKGFLTHNYSKIVAIADVYQALCSNRVYRKALLPHYTMNHLLKMAKLNLLDMEYVSNFLTYVSLYPIGSFVKLSDDTHAKVIQANERALKKPIVSCNKGSPRQ